jgi:hypothetical protein
MNEPRRCPDKELLVAYLYGEADAAGGREVEAHLAGCRVCATEIDGLRGVRTALSRWKPPDQSLGFRLVRDPVVVPIRRRWFTVPAWAQAAAAALILVAAGAGLANLDIRYGPEGLAVRTGWQKAPVAPEAAAVVPAAAPVPAGGSAAVAPWRADLVALAGQLREEIAASRPAPQPVAAASLHPAPSEAELLQKVSDMIAASEARQNRQLAQGLLRVNLDFARQRRMDLANINQGLGQLENRTGIVQTQNQEMMNYLVRVSQKK